MSYALLTPTVFISYSHKDEGWKNLLLPHLRLLEQAGRILVWDDRRIDGGENWYPEIQLAMEQAHVAICIISPDYLASAFCVKEELPFLLERRKQDGMTLIPLLVRPCSWQAFDWLRQVQMLPRDNRSVLVDFRGIEDVVFTEVANLVLRITSDPAAHFSTQSSAELSPILGEVFLERLVQTGAELFGREKELRFLQEVWAENQVKLVSLVADGGVGKSTLLNHWLKRLERSTSQVSSAPT